MATLVSPAQRQLATALVNDCGLKSAVLSGIAPDQRHLDRGGYHCSVEDLRRYGNSRDYSNSRPDDKDFNVKFAAAIDVTLNKADMIKVYRRIYAVWKDKADPRRKYVNCINVWDGSGDPVRLDFVTGKATRASKDHTWHFHNETRRRYANNPMATRAQISMYKGETKATWASREEGRPPVAKPATKPVIKYVAGSRVLQYVPGRPVMTGDDVKAVQQKIGTRAGKADGVFGAKTKAAVVWYQKQRKIRADGIVGPATWRHLGFKTNL